MILGDDEFVFAVSLFVDSLDTICSFSLGGAADSCSVGKSFETDSQSLKDCSSIMVGGYSFVIFVRSKRVNEMIKRSFACVVGAGLFRGGSGGDG